MIQSTLESRNSPKAGNQRTKTIRSDSIMVLYNLELPHVL